MSKEESVMAPQRKNNRKRKSSIAAERPRNIKHEGKMEQKEKKLRTRAIEIEEFVAEMKTNMQSNRRLVMEGQAMVEELKGRITQMRKQNKQHAEMILCGQLLADHIQTQYNIFP